jgi:hypothetical protein
MRIRNTFTKFFRFMAPADLPGTLELPAAGPKERAHDQLPAAPLASVADSGRIQFGGAFLLKAQK